MTAKEFFGFIAGTTVGLLVGNHILGWDLPWLFVLLPLWLPAMILLVRSLFVAGYRMIVIYWSVLDAVEDVYRSAIQQTNKKD